MSHPPAAVYWKENAEAAALFLLSAASDSGSEYGSDGYPGAWHVFRPLQIYFLSPGSPLPEDPPVF